MQAPCISASIDPAHWDACVSDAIVIAGDLIPGIVDSSLSYEDIRRALVGIHLCHVMALAMHLGQEFSNRGLTRDGVRQFMTLAEASRVVA